MIEGRTVLIQWQISDMLTGKKKEFARYVPPVHFWQQVQKFIKLSLSSRLVDGIGIVSASKDYFFNKG